MRKVFFGYIILLLLVLSPVFSGKMWLKVWDPYGKQVFYGEKSFSDSKAVTILSAPFKDYDLKYYLSNYDCGSSGSCNLLDTPYCRVGGWYSAEGHVQCHKGGSFYFHPIIAIGEKCSFSYGFLGMSYSPHCVFKNHKKCCYDVVSTGNHLYYCKTTEDLLSLVKIPKDWKGDSLLVYCHNGADNFFEEETFDDFIGPRLDTYKACVVKDLSKTWNNTIVFSLDVGNRFVDSDKRFFTNLSSHSRLLEGFTDGYSIINSIKTNNGFEVDYKQGVFSLKRRYKVVYNATNLVTMIYEGNEVPDVPLLSILPKTTGDFSEKSSKERHGLFSGSGTESLSLSSFNSNSILSKMNKSRVIVIKRDGGHVVYGFEEPENVFTRVPTDSEAPIYFVYIVNGGLTKESCSKSLAYYVQSGSVLCFDNHIEIPSRVLGNKESYLLFMNLVLNS